MKKISTVEQFEELFENVTSVIEAEEVLNNTTRTVLIQYAKSHYDSGNSFSSWKKENLIDYLTPTEGKFETKTEAEVSEPKPEQKGITLERVRELREEIKNGCDYVSMERYEAIGKELKIRGWNLMNKVCLSVEVENRLCELELFITENWPKRLTAREMLASVDVSDIELVNLNEFLTDLSIYEKHHNAPDKSEQYLNALNLLNLITGNSDLNYSQEYDLRYTDLKELQEIAAVFVKDISVLKTKAHVVKLIYRVAELYKLPPDVIRAQRISEENHNERIDFNDVISDIQLVAKALQKIGVKEFTISSGFSGLTRTLADFEKYGYKVSGMVEVKNHANELIPAVLMSA